MVEQQALNLRVEGSNPSGPADPTIYKRFKIERLKILSVKKADC